MGAKNAKLAKAAADAGLSKEEGQELYKVYEKLAGKQQGVSKQQFVRLTSAAGNGRRSALASEKYDTQDVAGKGSLDFPGFAKACALLRKEDRSFIFPTASSVADGSNKPAGGGRTLGGYTAAPSGNKPAAGGRTLGGQTAAPSGGQQAADDREIRARQAEARMQAAQRRGMGTGGGSGLSASVPAPAAPTPAAPTASPASTPGQPWPCPRCTFVNEASVVACAMCGHGRPDTAQTPMAEAALKRAESGGQGVTNEKAREMALQREKSEIVGQIRELARRLGEDEPFGLASMPLDKLRTYRTHLRGRVAGHGSGET